MVRRVIICLMDSVGVGHGPDAAHYDNDGVPDTGANTLGHIVERCAPAMPTLERLGILGCLDLAAGRRPRRLGEALIASAVELSAGKDTPSGHYELMGLPVLEPWGLFPKTTPCFPNDLVRQLVADNDLPGILGNRHSSGTVVLEEEGAVHCTTGQPILYTSADSVLQIAAHEDPAIFGLDRLYALCESARRLTEPLNIGRVIARPFVGSAEEGFTRTGNRRDYALLPPGPTVLDKAVAAGLTATAVGKVGDIFAMQGISRVVKATGLEALADATLTVMAEQAGGIIFTNFVDFDSEYGHRRDVQGYADALTYFDGRLAEIIDALAPDDLLVVTADHGNDPTWVGTDHTREQVPILLYGAGIKAGSAGQRESFADLGASIASYLNIAGTAAGRSLL